MPCDRLSPWMIVTVARAEWYRRHDLRQRALARGEAKAADAEADARLWDGIAALAEQTLVIAGAHDLSPFGIDPARAAAELAAKADIARAAWEKEGRPAGARRHDDLAELSRLIAALPQRAAEEAARHEAACARVAAQQVAA